MTLLIAEMDLAVIFQMLFVMNFPMLGICFALCFVFVLFYFHLILLFFFFFLVSYLFVFNFVFKLL